MGYRLKLRPEITLTKIEDRFVLFSKKTGLFFGLNEVGVEMLKGLETSDDLAVTRDLAQRYQVDEQQIAEDLTELVSSLEKAKLVEKTLSALP